MKVAPGAAGTIDGHRPTDPILALEPRRVARASRSRPGRPTSRSTAARASTRSSSPATTSSPTRTSPSTPRRSRSTPARRSTSAPGTSRFHATLKDNAISKIGITSTGLPDDATIELDGATLVGNTVDLEAFSGTLTTTVSGAGQTLPGGGTLNVASTDGFDSSGKFTVDGVTGTCAYTGDDRHVVHRRSRAAPARRPTAPTVETDIDQTGNSAGINYAAVQLIYDATVNIHGASTITAGGDVTISSTVERHRHRERGGRARQGQLDVGDRLQQGRRRHRHHRRQPVRREGQHRSRDDTTAPSTDSTHWEKADSKDSSVAATVLVANAKSQLSDTSSISATNGNVKISSSMTSNDHDGRRLVRRRLGRRNRRRRRRHRLRGVHRQHERHSGHRQGPDRVGRHERQHADHRQVEPERLEGQRHQLQRPDRATPRTAATRRRRTRRAARPTASRRPPTGTRTSAPRSP